ncbi:YceD family protein [Halomonas pacifica]|uniref:YceD family protein n=1 Tax=Bisbaumannia pacifica TaxID=77098 RepID=UPI002358C8F0|nr:YceD family protein [Halomonas pacifica]MDC8804283.1 YceD family protein [Halomonas pacifica]
MSKTQLPRQVEPHRLAANGESLQGQLALDALSRLVDEAGPQTGHCQVRLDFAIDPQGRRTIEGWLEAEVSLPCRRCLAPMASRVESHFQLGVVSSDAQAANLPGYLEPVLVENEQLNLLTVVEDELLLSLPQVVYHDETQCRVSRDQLTSGADSEASEKPAASPFEVLRTLKGKH